MKDPKFRELLADYAKELQDPANKKKYVILSDKQAWPAVPAFEVKKIKTPIDMERVVLI